MVAAKLQADILDLLCPKYTELIKDHKGSLWHGYLQLAGSFLYAEFGVQANRELVHFAGPQITDSF